MRAEYAPLIDRETFDFDMSGQFEAGLGAAYDAERMRAAQLQAQYMRSFNTLQADSLIDPSDAENRRSSLSLAAGQLAVRGVDETLFTILNDGQVREHPALYLVQQNAGRMPVAAAVETGQPQLQAA